MFGKRSRINEFRQEILNHGVQVASNFDVEIALPRSLREYVTVSSASGGGNWFDPPGQEGQERRVETVTVTARTSPANLQKTRKINMRCEAATLPDISMATVTNLRHGRGTRDIVPYSPIYYEPTLTFLGDQEGDVYRFFNNWVNSIMRIDHNTIDGIPDMRYGDQLYEVGYKKDIVSDELTINTYTQAKESIYSVKLFNAFPTSIFQTGLNWAAGTELMRFTVVFQYKDFKVI